MLVSLQQKQEMRKITILWETLVTVKMNPSVICKNLSAWTRVVD